MPLGHHREGSGKPLFLVHGIGLHWQTWRPVIELLARERDVIALDLPGFGASREMPADVEPTLQAFADAIEGFAAELGIERPHIAGNSLGGAVAIELARRGTIASAVALSPIGFWNAREYTYLVSSLRNVRRIAPRIAPFARALFAFPPARLLNIQTYGCPWRVPAEAIAVDTAAVARAPGFDRTLATAFTIEGFGRVPIVTRSQLTIAWGARDALLLPRQAQRARRLLPDARHVSLPGCGHIPFWDDPELVARTILDAGAVADSR